MYRQLVGKLGNPKVIADEDLFCQLKNFWKNYVLRDAHNPKARTGCGVLREISLVNEDGNNDDDDDDNNNDDDEDNDKDEFIQSIRYNGLRSVLSKKSSLLIDYCAFKIEEIQKGTSINRLNKRMQLVVGTHTSKSYVSPLKKLYEAYIEKCKDADRIITNYDNLKLNTLKQSIYTSSAKRTCTNNR